MDAAGLLGSAVCALWPRTSLIPYTTRPDSTQMAKVLYEVQAKNIDWKKVEVRRPLEAFCFGSERGPPQAIFAGAWSVDP